MSKKKDKKKGKLKILDIPAFGQKPDIYDVTSEILFRPLQSISDLSDPSDSPAEKKLSLSLTKNPIYATVLEGLNSGFGKATLVVPVTKKNLKKQLKKTDAWECLSSRFDGTKVLMNQIIEFIESDVSGDISVVAIKNLQIPIKNIDAVSTKETTVVFVFFNDEIIDSAHFEDNKKYIPEDYESDKLETNEEIIISIMADIVKKLGGKVITLMISPKDKIYDKDGGAGNHCFSAYANAILKVSKLDAFKSYIKAGYVNVSSEAMYSSLCR